MADGLGNIGEAGVGLGGGALERWVDASAREGGDGTQALPFKQLAPALLPQATVHLRSGLYPGPFVLPDRIHLVGHGEVVLYAEGEATVISASSATVEGVSVQGGFVGVRASGPVSLTRVHLSGHRRIAVSASGSLTVQDSVLEGTVSETVGIQLTRGAEAKLKGVRFLGAFRRAVDAEEAALEGEELTCDGPVQAFHLEKTRAHLRRVSVAGGRGPGIFAAEGALELVDATVKGHEYGLQAAKVELAIERFASDKAQFAGIAALRCSGTLTDISVERSGTAGGLQLLESTLRVKGVRLKQPQATGVMVRLGRLTLEDVTIDRVFSERGPRGDDGGDGLHLRDADVVARNIIVRDAEGTGVFVSAGARVELEMLRCERCRVGALVAELGSSVKIKGLVSRGSEGPAIAVPDRATVTLEDAEVVGTQAPIWVECGSGAMVHVKRLKSNLPQPPSACIEWPN
jgi:hypothetical protein